MRIRHFPMAFFCAVVATNSAIAAPKNSKKQTSSIGSIHVACLKQVGATYRPAEKRWYFHGPVSNAQWGAFYNCIDSHTMGRR